MEYFIVLPLKFVFHPQALTLSSSADAVLRIDISDYPYLIPIFGPLVGHTKTRLAELVNRGIARSISAAQTTYGGNTPYELKWDVFRLRGLAPKLSGVRLPGGTPHQNNKPYTHQNSKFLTLGLYF